MRCESPRPKRCRLRRIYQTKKRWIYKLLPWLEERQGKVIGEFICDKVICCQAYYGNSGEKHLTNLFGIELTQMCLTADELFNYIVGNKKEGTGGLWHITDLKIYDHPRALGEFRKICSNGECFDCIYEECKITRPPQSWMYVEELI